MLEEIVAGGGSVKICTSCAETRGLQDPVKGGEFGTLGDLTKVLEYDRVLTF
jgi:sulfur relay (sulfurtransferase) complex TusBCD TusD component (DsrE family)